MEQEQRREPDLGERLTAGAPTSGEGARSTGSAAPGGSVGGAEFKGLETSIDEVLAMEEGGAARSRFAGERQRRETRAAGDPPAADEVTRNRWLSGELRPDKRDPGARAERSLGEASGRASQRDEWNRAVDVGLRPAASRGDFDVVGTEPDGRFSKDQPKIGGARAERLEVGKPWTESRAPLPLLEADDRRRLGLSGMPMASPGRRPAQQVERRAEQAEPTVHITIGRLEVRGTAPAAAPPQRPSKPAPPVASLDEYLRGRNRGQRRE